MRIQPIVEGHGEVKAVPVLLRRLRDEMGTFDIEINTPIRSKRSNLVAEESLRRAVRLALLQDQCGAILILFDADDDCPRDLAPRIETIARDAAGTVPCAVVMATREFESWFLASLESLRGNRGIRVDATSHPAPETPRGAKEHLESYMDEGSSYSESADQAALTSLFDMGLAYRRCRSFRRMAKAFGELVVAVGADVRSWPPPTWLYAL